MKLTLTIAVALAAAITLVASGCTVSTGSGGPTPVATVTVMASPTPTASFNTEQGASPTPSPTPSATTASSSVALFVRYVVKGDRQLTAAWHTKDWGTYCSRVQQATDTCTLAADIEPAWDGTKVVADARWYGLYFSKAIACDDKIAAAILAGGSVNTMDKTIAREYQWRMRAATALVAYRDAVAALALATPSTSSSASPTPAPATSTSPA
jgi:hypothetical protein